jgi:hypothetical protein
MKRNLVVLGILLLVSAFILAACGGGGKGPAEEAIKAAEAAVATAKAEAGKFLPDDIKSLEGALAAVKDKFAKGDYKAVVGEAQGLVGKANDLVASAKTKKEELTKSWTTLSEGLPKMVGAIQSRVDILSKSKKLPANLTAEKFAEAKSGLEAATADWAKAQESFKSGNLAEAVALANTVKGKAVQAMEILGLPVPPAAK